MDTTKRTFGTRTQLTTSMADLGSVVRFDLINSQTFTHSFILDEALQLIETPVTYPIIHLPASIGFSDTFEVFHHNLVTIKVGNNIFTDVVVDPSHPTSFSARELIEKPFAGLSAYGLQFTAQVSELPFNLFNFCTVIEPTIRTDSEVIYSEVNAQNNTLRVVVLLSGSNLFRECEQEETSSLFIHPEKALIHIPSEIVFVTIRNIECKLLSAIEQPQDKELVFKIGTSRKIVSDRCSVNNWLRFGFLDHTTSLTHTSYSYLCREIELLPDCMVNSVMQFEILSDFMLPSIINTELESFSIGFDSSNNFWGWIDSDFSSGNNSHLIGEYIGTYKVSPPTTKVMGIRNEGIL